MVVYSGKDGVALVFDDGPNPKVTPKILEVLDKKGVKANFFLIGKRAEESPELVKQIFDGGHEIGNHTYTHKRLAKMLQDTGESAVLEEIQRGGEAIKDIIKSDAVSFLRPPYLDWDESVGTLVQPLYGDRIIMSGTKSGDYDWDISHSWDENDKESINNQAGRIVEDWSDAPSGTIIGLHDSSEHNLPGNVSNDGWMNRSLPTLKALPAIIDSLHQKGLKFQKLSEMSLVAVPLVTQRVRRTKL